MAARCCCTRYCLIVATRASDRTADYCLARSGNTRVHVNALGVCARSAPSSRYSKCNSFAGAMSLLSSMPAFALGAVTAAAAAWLPSP